MNSRLKKLIQFYRKDAHRAFLIPHDSDITYLTRYPSADSWLWVMSQEAVYITDARYVLEAKKHLGGIQVKCYTQSIGDALKELIRKNHIQSVCFDGRHLSAYDLKRLKGCTPKGVRWMMKNHLVGRLRQIKSPEEIRQIQKAIAINLKAFEFIKRYIKAGIKECQILDHLERFVKAQNVKFSFHPIIAFGPHSCYPHAKITDRKLQEGEPVLIDMGIDYQGYKSDLTRMFFLGKIPQLIQKTYTYVRAAQREAIQEIRPGIAVKDIDFKARKYLRKYKLAKYFSHSLGHGVGLEVHESPAISSKSSSILEEGMVFTVEPGVYIPGRFGIRYEDMVLVTKKGYKVLSDNIH
ncbi:MAG: Xaa-Pro peptidase family protein [Candidatus Omnitrophota bacterium]